MKKICLPIIALLAVVIGLSSCGNTKKKSIDDTSEYLNFKTEGEYQAAGVQMIKLKEGYKVWTKRYGNSPMKVLLLHGGPGATHEYMECFQSFFPKANIEFYEYDQLGSAYSDQPDDQSLWTIDRFVEEVEQVRIKLGLNKDNFYLFGSSWGGILAMEYADKYQKNLKGLIISNMTASFESCRKYNQVLRSQLDPKVLKTLLSYEKKNDLSNPKYVDLVQKEFYNKHICRCKEWPEPVVRGFSKINPKVYVYMQGPSEFIPAGTLTNWTFWDRLKDLTVPTLSIGAKYDSMNPKDMEKISTMVQNGRFLYCPNGSHLSMWDEQELYMDGIVKFIKDVYKGDF